MSGQFLNSGTDSTFSRYSPRFYHFRYSHRFYHFPILVWTVFLYSHGFYLSQYLPGFYHFPVLTQILPFSDTPLDSFFVLARILPFPGTPLILPFSSIHTDSTFFRKSSREFFNSGTESTIPRYSSGFYHFPVLTLILPFSVTRTDSFSIVAQILPFPGTCPDSTNF